MEHTHSWFYYFYWILLHDCQGRPSRITFNVVLDVRSFLTTQEDGRTLHRASTNRCDIDASPHLIPTESFFPSVPRLLRHSSLMQRFCLLVRRTEPRVLTFLWLFSHYALSRFDVSPLTSAVLFLHRQPATADIQGTFFFNAFVCGSQILRCNAAAGDEKMLLSSAG